MGNLERLRELTPNLPNLQDLILDRTNGKVKFTVFNKDGQKLPDESCVSNGLLGKKEVSVADTCIKAGSIFPAHSHESTEFLIVYSGKIKAELLGDIIELETAQCLHISPNVSHQIMALEDTLIICISIPQDRGFPNVG